MKPVKIAFEGKDRKFIPYDSIDKVPEDAIKRPDYQSFNDFANDVDWMMREPKSDKSG